MRRFAWWRIRPSLLSSCLLCHRRRHTSCLHDVPYGQTRLSDQFGVEAAEQDGSDADDDAPPHLTGDYCQSTGTKSTYYSFWKHTHHNTDKMEMVRNGPAGNIILPPPLGIIRPPLKYQSPISPATAIVKYDIIRPIR